MRIPAREIEAAVAERVAEALDDPIGLTTMSGLTLHSGDLRQTIALAKGLAEQVRAKDYQLVRELVSSVRVRASEITIELSAEALAGTLKIERDNSTQANVISLVAKVRLTRTGRAVRLVQSNGLAATARTPDPGLVALLVTARRWWGRLSTDEIDIATLSREEGVNDSWMLRVIRVNFLLPQIIDAILTWTQPANLTARWLRRNDLPLDWDEQWDLLAGWHSRDEELTARRFGPVPRWCCPPPRRDETWGCHPTGNAQTRGPTNTRQLRFRSTRKACGEYRR